MIFRLLDSNGDWLFGKGINDYAVGQQAIGLNIQTLVLSWVGDCFFDLPAGVDWTNRLDVGQQTALVDEVKSVILKAFGVVGVNIVSAVFNSSTRQISVSYDVDTIYGQNFQNQILASIGELAA